MMYHPHRYSENGHTFVSDSSPISKLSNGGNASSRQYRYGDSGILSTISIFDANANAASSEEMKLFMSGYGGGGGSNNINNNRDLSGYSEHNPYSYQLEKEYYFGDGYVEYDSTTAQTEPQQQQQLENNCMDSSYDEYNNSNEWQPPPPIMLRRKQNQQNNDVMNVNRHDTEVKNTLLSEIQTLSNIKLDSLGRNFSVIQIRGSPSTNKFGKRIEGAIGVDWLPPLNADIRLNNAVVITSPNSVVATATASMPINFTWTSLNDVMYRFSCKDSSKLLKSSNSSSNKSDYVVPPFDQGVCGSCWAQAGAGFLSDRFRIWTNERTPVLSPSVIISCAVKPNGNKCEGGNATAVYQVCSGGGVVSEEQAPYDAWCKGPTYASCNSSKVPNCSSAYGGMTPRFYGAKQPTNDATAVAGTYGKGNYDAIRKEVYNNGPVMTGFFVYADLMGDSSKPASTPLWSSTKGIYMNSTTESIYDYKSNGRLASSQKLGAHMVCIVGYGTTKANGITGPDWTSSDPFNNQTSTIWYWVARNSWGSSWNASNINNKQVATTGGVLQGGGFFYVAFSGQYTFSWISGGNKKVDVNKDIGFDHPATTARFGGCWFFSPKIEGGRKVTDTIPGGCGGGGDDNDNNDPVDDEPVDDDNDDNDRPHHRKEKPPPSDNDKSWLSKWNQFIGSLTSCDNKDSNVNCSGVCVWDGGQCLNSTYDICSLISSGTGSFIPGNTCEMFIDGGTGRGSKAKKVKQCEPEEIRPSILEDGCTCLMTTKDVSDKIGGTWFEKDSTCDEAKARYTRIKENRGKIIDLFQKLKEKRHSSGDSSDEEIASIMKQIDDLQQQNSGSINRKQKKSSSASSSAAFRKEDYELSFSDFIDFFSGARPNDITPATSTTTASSSSSGSSTNDPNNKKKEKKEMNAWIPLFVIIGILVVLFLVGFFVTKYYINKK